MVARTARAVDIQQHVVDTPAAYDAAEQSALLTLPNRIIEASQAVAFQTVGYPTHIKDIRELWRYADVMHEGEARAIFDQIGGLTANEFVLVQAVTRKVVYLTEKLGHRVVPGSSLILAAIVYRAIKRSYPLGCRVFELGGGSGYVGALLQADIGYTYFCSDVSQAFVLWQAYLLKPETVIPWWEWMRSSGPPVQVITANHMLNEMHPHALKHLARQAQKMLQPGGLFLAENFGSAVLRSTADTLSELMTFGINVTPVGNGLDAPLDRVVQWDDLVNWWERDCGGIPMSEDEMFLGSL